MEKAKIEAIINELVQAEDYYHACEILKNYTLKELEPLWLFVGKRLTYLTSEEEKLAIQYILSKRFCLLRDEYKPTEKDVKEICRINDKFLEAWEESFSMVKAMADVLYERESDKNSFMDKYEFEIKLRPQVVCIDSKTGELDYQNSIYDVLSSFIDDIELHMDVFYNPATRDESDFWNNPHISKETNWNTTCGVPDTFENYYISYSIHELYEHSDWTLQDIAKINNIYFDIKIEYRRF